MINTVSITDLKQNTSKIIKKVKTEGKSLIILQRSKAAAVLVDPDYFDILEESKVPFDRVASKLKSS
jgi:prevent-host-death family protein